MGTCLGIDCVFYYFMETWERGIIRRRILCPTYFISLWTKYFALNPWKSTWFVCFHGDMIWQCSIKNLEWGYVQKCKFFNCLCWNCLLYFCLQFIFSWLLIVTKLKNLAKNLRHLSNCSTSLGTFLKDFVGIHTTKPPFLPQLVEKPVLSWLSL